MFRAAIMATQTASMSTGTIVRSKLASTSATIDTLICVKPPSMAAHLREALIRPPEELLP